MNSPAFQCVVVRYARYARFFCSESCLVSRFAATDLQVAAARSRRKASHAISPGAKTQCESSCRGVGNGSTGTSSMCGNFAHKTAGARVHATATHLGTAATCIRAAAGRTAIYFRANANRHEQYSATRFGCVPLLSSLGRAAHYLKLPLVTGLLSFTNRPWPPSWFRATNVRNVPPVSGHLRESRLELLRNHYLQCAAFHLHLSA